MANDINSTIINDGPRNHVVEIRVTGDGSGEETAASIIDVSGIAGAPTAVSIEKIYAVLTGFSASLMWDATTDTVAFELAEGDTGLDFTCIGGPIKNNSGAGKTGDLLMKTVGLGSGDVGYIRIHAKKN